LLAVTLAVVASAYCKDSGGPPAAPAAPSNLTAVAAPGSATQINLQWQDNAANEDGFQIERAPGGTASFTEIASVGPNASSYQSTGLSAGTSYSYRVLAYNAGGTSGYSNTATVTTLSTPAAPTNLVATVASGSQINLAWTDNATNEDGFRIERAPEGTTSFIEIATVGPSVTTFQNTGLTPGTGYSYRVRASNGVGNSPYSNMVTATTVGAGAPSSLVLTPKSLIVDVGSTAGTTVTVQDPFGDPVANPLVTYVSRNPSAASVSAAGTVTGETRGQAVVTARAEGGSSPADSLLAVVAVPGGPVLMADIAQFSYQTNAVVTITVIMDMRASGELLGSTRVLVTWNPSVLAYQSHTNGGSGVSPTVNASNAASGSLALAMADANGFAGRVELLRITFRAGPVAGVAGYLGLATSEVAGAGTFTDLLAQTVAVTHPLATR